MSKRRMRSTFINFVACEILELRTVLAAQAVAAVVTPEQAFAKLDTNKDNALSLTEFKAAPKPEGATLTAEQCFAKADADKNGSLSLAEFKTTIPPPPTPRTDLREARCRQERFAQPGRIQSRSEATRRDADRRASLREGGRRQEQLAEPG